MRVKVMAATAVMTALLLPAGPAMAACIEVPYQREVVEQVPDYKTVPGPTVTQTVQVLSGEWRDVTVQEPRTGYTTTQVYKPVEEWRERTVEKPVVEKVPYIVSEPYQVPIEVIKWKPEEYTYYDDVPYTYTVTVPKTVTTEVPVFRQQYTHKNYYSGGDTKCHYWDAPVNWCYVGTGRYGGHVNNGPRSIQVGTNTVTTIKYVEETRQGTKKEKRTGSRLVKVVETKWETRYKDVTYYQDVTRWVPVIERYKETVWKWVTVEVPYTYYVSVTQRTWVPFWTTQEVQVPTYVQVPTGTYTTITTLVWDVRMEGCPVQPS